MAGLNEIPSFQTLSRRARSFDLHAINREIVFLYSMKECAAIDSFMIHTCKYSTARGENNGGITEIHIADGLKQQRDGHMAGSAI